ncbi:hypothetical protein ERC79_01895 [Rhodococcus sp. ABRD24]|uniref:hypothetical protein n=1 Tax=Rhodococcus sp. ABRD24 TaxID=2507582 RepID=UPI00103DB141|nr:hypothetical protein [Rhodococcus sp. ABRD24]QBJ94855.1 hypothetical protein ERC79_01895 [Rhodococcus sp. ABRD24]
MGELTRRRSAIAAAIVAGGVTLTACGGSGDEPAPTTSADLGAAATAPNPPTAGPITDPDALRAALLTAADLPPGFAPLPDPVADLGLDPAPDDGAADRPGTDPARCANVLDIVARQFPSAVTDAEGNFAGPGFTSIDVDAASYPGTGAADAFAVVQATFRECRAYRGADADGTPVQYRLEPLQQPPVGDASASVRVTTTSEGFTLVSDAVLAVVGSTVVQVVTTGPDPADSVVLNGLARTATERIRSAAGT